MAEQVTIAILPLLVPPLLLLVSALRGDGSSPWAPLVGMTVLVLLALVRTTRLLRSEAKARSDAHASRRHYARLAANSSDAVVVVGRDRRVTEHSPQVASLLGYHASSEGVDLAEVLHAVDRTDVESPFAMALASPGEVVTSEVLVTDPEGGRRPSGSACAWSTCSTTATCAESWWPSPTSPPASRSRPSSRRPVTRPWPGRAPSRRSWPT